jgi:hypothetical protein
VIIRGGDRPSEWAEITADGNGDIAPGTHIGLGCAQNSATTSPWASSTSSAPSLPLFADHLDDLAIKGRERFGTHLPLSQRQAHRAR